VHGAPPVRVSLRRSAAWPVFVGLCGAAAVGNIVAWGLHGFGMAAGWPTALLAALVAGGAASSWAQRASGEGELTWDGAQWHWQGGAGRAHAAIDLGDWMLLRFAHTTGRSGWIAAGRAATDGPWAALRAALYSPQAADPLGAPPPG
jgi:hypothetical protein